MKKFLRNRGFAAGICAMCILLSLLLGSGRSMRRVLRPAVTCFQTEAQPLLAEKAGYAANFTVIARRTDGADAGLTSRVERCADTLTEATDLWSAAEANLALDEAVEALVAGLEAGALTDGDRALLRTNLDDYNAKSVQLRLCGCNDAAQTANEKLSGPIPTLLRLVNGVELAPLFP